MIEFEAVSRDYKVGNEIVQALDNISMSIKDGEFVSLIGPSGSGKTTLLNLIGGLEAPSAGKISVDGQDISRLNDRQLSQYRANEVGFVFQTFNLLPRYNALLNVMMPGLISGRSRKELMASATGAIEAVGLKERENHLPNSLSGGESQRVAIARALLNGPKIMLADEPTGNLDEKNAQLVLDLIITLCRERKRTLVLVTHNPELAKRADRIIKLHAGRIEI